VAAHALAAEGPKITYTRPPSLPKLGDKYAVIEIGGVQHIVEEGRWYKCNRLKAEVGSTIKMGRVLVKKHNDNYEFGRPYLEHVNVEATILEECKGPKLIVFKYKAKKHYRRKTGHRQKLTKFLITKIE